VKLKIFYCIICLSALLFSCADPLKSKPPYWYDGYVYGTRAHDLFAEGKLSAALSFYKKGLAQALNHDIPEQAALYRFNAGRCFYELNKFDSASTYFTSAHIDYSLCNKPDEARQAAGFAALAFCATGQNDSAFFWYQKGVITPVTNADKAFWLMVHGRLAWAKDHSKESLAYIDEAYDVYMKEKSYHGAAQMRMIKSAAYSYFGDVPEAVKQIDSALVLDDKTQLRFDRFRMLLRAASAYTCANDNVRAQWFFDRALHCIPDGIKPPAKDQVLTCKKDAEY
jgi:tetratricopeptide (TPR) repeat protein